MIHLLMYRNKFLEHEAKELKQITAEVMNTIVVKTNNSRLESHILLHTSKSYYFY